MSAQRQLVVIITKLCKSLGIKIQQYASGWILELTYKNKSQLIYGYKFPVDKSTVQMLCDDKAGLSEKLSNSKIPCVMHWYVMSPNNWHYQKLTTPPLATAKKLLAELGTIVVKPNIGTGGEHVYKIVSNSDLNTKTQIIFQKYPALSFAPYYQIQNEYRVVLIKQKPYLIYEKVKNKSWKHNLSQGAKVNIILSKPLKTKLSTLALNAAKAININFCAVDIIQVDNKLMILEINSGLMFEQFSQIKPNLQIVNHIYRTILKYMFNIN